MKTDFNLVFNLHQGGEAMDDYITGVIKPYLREGDVLVLVTGNGVPPGDGDKVLEPFSRKEINYRAVDMDEINRRLAGLKEKLKGIEVKVDLYTAGHAHLKEVIAGLDPAHKDFIFGIHYGYEPSYLPEFRHDADLSVELMKEAARLIRDAGFKACAAPSGRGLSDDNRFSTWNYGRFAQVFDEMIVQTQSRLRSDAIAEDLNIPSYKLAASKLYHQIKREYPSLCRVYPQITISDSAKAGGVNKVNTNAAPVQYALEGFKFLKALGFPGASFWYSTGSQPQMLAIVKYFRE